MSTLSSNPCANADLFKSPLSGVVSGSRSGCGKTTTVLALMAALGRRGLVVQGCKAGPDFIDPGYHARITGRPSFNLDTWMSGPAGLLRSFARAASARPQADVLLIEGAMGLFDGAEESGSAAHLASVLDLPVLLVLDANGMGQSIAALAKGFVEFKKDPRIGGIICTHAGSERHCAIIREALARSSVPLLGILPRRGAPRFESRHLGLLMADENDFSSGRLEQMAAWFEANVDVEALLGVLERKQCPAPEPLRAAGSQKIAIGLALNEPRDNLTGRSRGLPQKIAIGLALDEAFCFIYPDLPDLLREYGAEAKTFSPLRDAAPPPGCAALIFPGGYPELHAARLEANKSMREAVRAFAAQGKTVYGECGGYMYLMESLEVDNKIFSMSGCLPLSCRFEGRLAALGYREARPGAQCCFGDSSDVGRGHEYHYSTLKDDSNLPPLWLIADSRLRSLGPEGACYGSAHGSWVHLFPEGSKSLWKNFVRHIQNMERTGL